MSLNQERDSADDGVADEEGYGDNEADEVSVERFNLQASGGGGLGRTTCQTGRTVELARGSGPGNKATR